MNKPVKSNSTESNLLAEFQAYWLQNACWKPGDGFFLACSGGLDSVVLSQLLSLSSIPFELLHCNFQLRGEESQRDEDFVRDLAQQLNVPIKVKYFDTRQEMANRKMGLQEVARQLRYDWFNSVLQESAAKGHEQWLLTAHHTDDQIETIAMNFFRGTGLPGLRGMSFRNGHLIRPLLFASREAIEQFARVRGLSWVEDSSNSDVHYTRNLFRNNILPEIKKAFPQAGKNILHTAQHLRDVAWIYYKDMDKMLEKLMEVDGDKVMVPVNKLKKSAPLDTVIYELFTRFGFSTPQIPEIKKLLDASSGKFMLSSTHRVFKNRAWLVIHPIDAPSQELIIIESPDETVPLFDRNFTVSLTENSLQPDTHPLHAWLDAKEIAFPLIIRPWKNGDYFYPLGMHKKKKLSRFMTDLKLSRQEKEQQWVVESDKKIIWVIGRRIDDRFKITHRTQKVMRLTWT
jgi:tRNA(Ile)-lysidine synthase